MVNWTDDIISGRGVSIAVRDYGGAGAPVVLIHGAGRTLADFSPMAATMVSRYRVVAMDLRCHGRSGDGPWAWDAVLDDVAAVIDHFQLDRPAIIGHSLGGMIAAMWTAEHRECRGGVNLDGHYRAEEATVRRAELEAKLRDIAGDVAAARPTPVHTESLMKAVNDLDLIAVYERSQAPLRIVNCVRPDPDEALLGLDWLPDYMAAYRRGLAAALTELADRKVLVSHVQFDGDHSLVLNQPDRVAELVMDFLDDQ
jgi:pimeloyl-ACP methyl ester carboxylesterase